jgi:hypothetical protein
MAHRSQGTIYVRVVVGGGAIIVVAHNLYHLLMQCFYFPSSPCYVMQACPPPEKPADSRRAKVKADALSATSDI